MKRKKREREREHGLCANKVTIKANTDYIMQDKMLMNRGGGFVIN